MEVATILAAGTSGPFVIDGGVSGIVVGALALAGVVFTTIRADRAGKRAAAAAEQESDGEHELGVITQARELEAFINERVKDAVAEATKDLRRELAALRTGLGLLRGRVRHLRRAFREYVHNVEETWGTTEGPPKMSTEVHAMLYDDDLLDLEDTLTGDDVRNLRARALADKADYEPGGG
jgi:hypothetical protein